MSGPTSSFQYVVRMACLLMLVIASPAIAKGMKLSDGQIAAAIVQASRQAYYATGHPCACPEDHARNGSRCGGRSAYSRPGGAEPKCYVSDVTAAEIAAYRKSH